MSKFLKKVSSLGFAVSVAMASSFAVAGDSDENKLFYEFNDKGEMIKPDAEVFREWIFVGSPLTPNDLNGGESSFPEFHSVYIDPVSWDIYKKTGVFREGTMLIKELTSVGATKATSGNGYFNGEYSGLEATIKSKALYPDEPGNWAYFSFGHSYPLAETAPARKTAECATCHTVSAAEDMVFTQFYPVLRAAKSKVDGKDMKMDKEMKKEEKTSELHHKLPMPSKDDLALVATEKLK